MRTPRANSSTQISLFVSPASNESFVPSGESRTLPIASPFTNTQLFPARSNQVNRLSPRVIPPDKSALRFPIHQRCHCKNPERPVPPPVSIPLELPPLRIECLRHQRRVAKVEQIARSIGGAGYSFSRSRFSLPSKEAKYVPLDADQKLIRDRENAFHRAEISANP